MIDVVSRRCQHPQCVRRPLYAMPGQRAMFCRTHKDPGHTDVVSRRCNFEVSAEPSVQHYNNLPCPTSRSGLSVFHVALVPVCLYSGVSCLFVMGV